jgi:hypothetical protein
VQILSFIVIIVVFGIGTLALGYSMSLLRGQAAGRRCRMPRRR